MTALGSEGIKNSLAILDGASLRDRPLLMDPPFSASSRWRMVLRLKDRRTSLQKGSSSIFLMLQAIRGNVI